MLRIVCPFCENVYEVEELVFGHLVGEPFRCFECGETFSARCADDEKAAVEEAAAALPSIEEERDEAAMEGASAPASSRPLTRLPELLERYRRTVTVDLAVTDTVSDLLRGPGLRRGAATLRQEIDEFREKMETTQEALALAALGVAPERLIVTEELREMGVLLGVVSAGSGSPRRHVDGDPEPRLRELMVAIGRKAEMAGLDSPEIVALRERVSRLRAALGRREAKLARGEEGRTTSSRSRVPRLHRVALVVALLVVFGAALEGWRVAAKRSRERPRLTGALAELAPCFDQSVTGFLMVRCGDMLRQLSDDLPRLSERMAAASPFEFVGLAATWVAADVDRITVLLRETGRPMLVLETRRDYPLVDVTEAVGKTVHYRGASYLPARDGWFVGRVGANAFCATGDEESMCLLLERLIEGEAGNIRGDLARALSNCTAFEQLVVCWVGCESREETPGWATPGSVLLQIALSGQCAVSLNARLAFTEERYTANVAFELQELVKGSGATEIERVESRGEGEDGGAARETPASVDASGGVVQISTRCSLDTFLKQVPPLSGMVSTHALASGISSAARRVFEAQVQQVVQGTDK